MTGAGPASGEIKLAINFHYKRKESTTGARKYQGQNKCGEGVSQQGRNKKKGIGGGGDSV